MLDVTSGVPQGSILGPILFILFINDMISTVSPQTNIVLYADDTKIWRTITSWDDHIQLQKDISALYNWSILNKMRFHPDKCSVLTVSNKHIEYVLPFDRFGYHLNGVYLNYVSSQRDLGVRITSNFMWKTHCSNLARTASSRLGLLKRTLHFSRSKDQKRIFYLSLVRSIFEHCSVIWHPYTSGDMERFEQIQKRGVKWILGEQFHSYTPEVFLVKQHSLDLLPMKTKFNYTDLVLFHQIVHLQICIELPSYLTPIPRDSVRDRLVTANAISSDIGIENVIVSEDYLQFNCTMRWKVDAFKHGFFPRVHQEWNKLPFGLRKIEKSLTFKEELKVHLWKTLMPD